ncbi:MAG: hypothetical protein FWB95_03985 [Treponema sp.]|nr:hypothetical protein [Treponema sp.]
MCTQFYKKSVVLTLFLLIFSISAVYAQRAPSIGVFFEASGTGVTPADINNITNKIITELNSWGTLNASQGADKGEYTIRGALSIQSGNFIASAVTVNASSGQQLNEYQERGRTLNDISITSFCSSAVDKVPLPNYLLGTWRSIVNMPDGPVVCIIEFGTGRRAAVERYDTWEHKRNNALRYEGYGAGSYTYIGYANRQITVNAKQVRIDAVFSVSLALEETLPEQTNVNTGSLAIIFNSDKTSFEVVNGSLLCGRNHDGPSVYPAAVIGFSQFVKIR